MFLRLNKDTPLLDSRYCDQEKILSVENCLLGEPRWWTEVMSGEAEEREWRPLSHPTNHPN